jgi:hypothetical protein
LPATIEGAIRSGLAAAEAIARLSGARIARGPPDTDSPERSDDTRTGGDDPRREAARLAR